MRNFYYAQLPLCAKSTVRNVRSAKLRKFAGAKMRFGSVVLRSQVAGAMAQL
jgi:hypothetical protein